MTLYSWRVDYMSASLAEALEQAFSEWQPWAERELLPHLGWPGVYAIAHTNDTLSGSSFRWSPLVIYIGMTNSAGGLRSRLRQFDRTMRGKEGHGGAQRVRRKYSDYGEFCTRAYVSVLPFACEPTSNMPKDLRLMGTVARAEYDCFAEFAERFGSLPEFNDKKRSPKLKDF